MAKRKRRAKRRKPRKRRAKRRKKARRKKAMPRRRRRRSKRRRSRFGGLTMKNLGFKIVQGVAAVAGTEIMTSSDVGAGDGVISQGLALMSGNTDIQTVGETLLSNYQNQDLQTNVKKIFVGTLVTVAPSMIKKGVNKVMKMLR